MSGAVGSALALLGENPIPQGTPDELRKVGVDPARVASCAPRSPGVRGCALWESCPFAQTKLGGFKGQGPRYVGYFLKTHEDRMKQDIATCHAFTRTLWGRMTHGIAQALKGGPHEIVRIIAQEGETIRTRVAVPVNPADKTPGAAYKFETKTVEVPRHPRPGEAQTQLGYEAELWQEELIRRKYDPEFQTGPPPELPMIAAEPDDFEAEAVPMDVLDLGTPSAEPVVAEPVERKKK